MRKFIAAVSIAAAFAFSAGSAQAALTPVQQAVIAEISAELATCSPAPACLVLLQRLEATLRAGGVGAADLTRYLTAAVNTIFQNNPTAVPDAYAGYVGTGGGDCTFDGASFSAGCA